MSNSQLPPGFRPIPYPSWVHIEGFESVLVQNEEEERLHRERIRRVRWERARDVGRKRANAAQQVRADALARELAPEIALLRLRGLSYRAVATELNKAGRPTARHRKWGAPQVLRLLRRAGSEHGLAVGIALQSLPLKGHAVELERRPICLVKGDVRRT